MCGLDGDSNQAKFGHITDLIPLCDKVKKLKSVCNLCGNKAIFTKQKLSNADTSNQIDIGGSEKYIAVCRRCSAD